MFNLVCTWFYGRKVLLLVITLRALAVEVEELFEHILLRINNKWFTSFCGLNFLNLDG